MLTSENAGNDSLCISANTKVRFNSRMGKVYFAIIKPFHNIICKTLWEKTERKKTSLMRYALVFYPFNLGR